MMLKGKKKGEKKKGKKKVKKKMEKKEETPHTMSSAWMITINQIDTMYKSYLYSTSNVHFYFQNVEVKPSSPKFWLKILNGEEK